MIADYDDGDQNILDITAFNKSLTIAWIVKYFSDDCKSKWKGFLDFYLPKLGGKLVFLGNLWKKDATKHDIKDDFLRELIEIWVELTLKTLSSPNTT